MGGLPRPWTSKFLHCNFIGGDRLCSCISVFNVNDINDVCDFDTFPGSAHARQAGCSRRSSGCR